MSTTGTQTTFVTAFLLQVDALDPWLEKVLENAGIVGAPARRARTRVLEMRDEINEVSVLIAKPLDKVGLSKLTTYADFDPSQIFDAELAKRADAGVQDLGSAIQDELAGIARARKKELENKLAKDKPLDLASMAIWQQMSACDCVEEIAATLYRLAEAARFLYQTEFLRVISQASLELPVPPPATPQ